MKMYSSLRKYLTSILIRLAGYDQRDYISWRYIKGAGIEIGALNNPLKIRKSAMVRYVDKLSIADLEKQYPDLDSKEFVSVDVVDNGEELATFDDESQDFVVANHFLEHCQNPIHAIKNMLRVLKPEGVLFLAVPDKRYTFDGDRPVTTLAHLMEDYASGPDVSQRGHYSEWVRLVSKIKNPTEVERQTADLIRSDYSIHYHVWTQAEILELLIALKKMFTFETELFVKNGAEMIVILRKRA